MKSIVRSGLAAIIAATVGMLAVAQESKSDQQLLQEALRQREIATQKAEAELREAIKNANAAGTTEAIAILKQALSSVESNASLSEGTRSAMTQMLNDRLRIAKLSPKTRGNRSTEPATTSKDDRQRTNLADLRKREEERKRVQAEVKAIDKLVGQERTQEAEKRAAELASEYSNNPAARVMGRKSFIIARIREANDLLKDQESRLRLAMNDVMKSSIPANGTIEFDKKRWKEITKLRKDDQLTKKEKEILQRSARMSNPTGRIRNSRM